MTAPPSRPDNAFARWQRARPRTYDAILLLVFLVLVYVWALRLPAVGADFARLSDAVEMPEMIRALISAQLGLFGATPFLYHVSNFALLFVNMLLVYWLFQRLFPESRRWLGRLAAVLFMANPAYSDGILAMTAAYDLVPTVIALGALVAQADARGRKAAMRSRAAFAVALLTGTGAALHFPLLINLPWLLLLHECFYAKGRISVTPRAIGYAFAGVVVWAFAGPETFPMDPGQTIAPLYFILYPIGFLPETVRLFAARPVIGWIAAAGALGVVLLIARIANRGVVWFCIVGAMLLRVGLGVGEVDPVHLIGGGQLMLPGALAAIAVAAVFGRMLDHPKWPRNAVVLSSLLALLLMALQIRTIAAWRVAGRVVTEFQAAVAAAPTTGGGEATTIGVLPDYTAYHGAPIQLSESIAYDTPFSRRHPHLPLLRLAYDLPDRLTVGARYFDEVWDVQIAHPELLSLIPASYDTTGIEGAVSAGGAAIERIDLQADRLWLVIRPPVVIETVLPAIERVP